MSIAVSLDRLREETQRFGATPYLLTVSDDARAHATAVTVEWQDDELVMGVGSRSARNAAARPEVSLLWPPFEPGGYSLISDGVVRDTGRRAARVRSHECGAAPPGRRAIPQRQRCTADCVPLTTAGVKRSGSRAGPQIAVCAGFHSISPSTSRSGIRCAKIGKRLLKLGPGEPGAEAVVDATAEREVR